MDADMDSGKGRLDRLAAVGGAALRGVFAVLTGIRHPRPIHSRGLILTGEIAWLGTNVQSGVSWIDEAPPDAPVVTARLSRSAGLPAPLPDVIGLALRVERDDERSDILLSSTGLGFPGRFLLAPHRSPSRADFTTLMPYRTARGPLLIAARPDPGRRLPSDLDGTAESLAAEPWRLRLYFARPRERWHPFAGMTLSPSTVGDDAALRFDAVEHPPTGAASYRWIRLLRQPAYRLVQREVTPDGRRSR